MSLSTEAFRPGANTARLDVTATTGSVALPGGPGGVIEVDNSGNGVSGLDWVFFITGVGAQTAVAPASGSAIAGWAVGPGKVRRIRIPPNHDTLAAICAATKTATIFVSRGDGGT